MIDNTVGFVMLVVDVVHSHQKDFIAQLRQCEIDFIRKFYTFPDESRR